jgi:hypothetical protein
MKTILREGTRQDLPFLREMLFEAVSWRSDALRPPTDEHCLTPSLPSFSKGGGVREMHLSSQKPLRMIRLAQLGTVFGPIASIRTATSVPTSPNLG